MDQVLLSGGLQALGDRCGDLPQGDAQAQSHEAVRERRQGLGSLCHGMAPASRFASWAPSTALSTLLSCQADAFCPCPMFLADVA